MIELDIPSFTDEGIQMRCAFEEVKELDSYIDFLIMIEMLILLIGSVKYRFPESA